MKLNNIHYVPVPVAVMTASRTGFLYLCAEPAMCVGIYQGPYAAGALLPIGAGYHPMYQFAPDAGFEPLEAGKASAPFLCYDTTRPAMLVVVTASEVRPDLQLLPAPLPFPLLTSLVLGYSIVDYGTYVQVVFDNGAQGTLVDPANPEAHSFFITGGQTWAELKRQGAVFNAQ